MLENELPAAKMKQVKRSPPCPKAPLLWEVTPRVWLSVSPGFPFCWPLTNHDLDHENLRPAREVLEKIKQDVIMLTVVYNS